MRSDGWVTTAGGTSACCLWNISISGWMGQGCGWLSEAVRVRRQPGPSKSTKVGPRWIYSYKWKVRYLSTDTNCQEETGGEMGLSRISCPSKTPGA